MEGDPGWTGQEEVRCGVPRHVQQGQQGKFHGKPHSLYSVPTPRAARFVEIGISDPDPPVPSTLIGVDWTYISA